jgi:hypothetical protein
MMLTGGDMREGFRARKFPHSSLAEVPGARKSGDPLDAIATTSTLGSQLSPDFVGMGEICSRKEGHASIWPTSPCERVPVDVHDWRVLDRVKSREKRELLQ